MIYTVVVDCYYAQGFAPRAPWFRMRRKFLIEAEEGSYLNERAVALAEESAPCDRLWKAFEFRSAHRYTLPLEIVKGGLYKPTPFRNSKPGVKAKRRSA